MKAPLTLPVLLAFAVLLAWPPTLAVASMPRQIDIFVRSAAIAPTKVGGRPWRAFGSITPQQLHDFDGWMTKIAVAAAPGCPGASIAGELTAAFAPSIVGGLSQPQIYGVMSLAPHGAFTGASVAIASPAAPVEGFRPQFGDAVSFRHVAWDPQMKIRVELKNKHTFLADDPLGTVDVPAHWIERANDLGVVTHFHTGGQDPNIRLISLEVTRSG